MIFGGGDARFFDLTRRCHWPSMTLVAARAQKGPLGSLGTRAGWTSMSIPWRFVLAAFCSLFFPGDSHLMLRNKLQRWFYSRFYALCRTNVLWTKKNPDPADVQQISRFPELFAMRSEKATRAFGSGPSHIPWSKCWEALRVLGERVEHNGAGWCWGSNWGELWWLKRLREAPSAQVIGRSPTNSIFGNKSSPQNASNLWIIAGIDIYYVPMISPIWGFPIVMGVPLASSSRHGWSSFKQPWWRGSSVSRKSRCVGIWVGSEQTWMIGGDVCMIPWYHDAMNATMAI